MIIELDPETERQVREEIGSGHFRSVDELIQAGVQALREKNTPPGKVVSGASGKEKARAFGQWAESHTYTPPLSDEAISRAGMNPDRW